MLSQHPSLNGDGDDDKEAHLEGPAVASAKGVEAVGDLGPPEASCPPPSLLKILQQPPFTFGMRGGEVLSASKAAERSETLGWGGEDGRAAAIAGAAPETWLALALALVLVFALASDATEAEVSDRQSDGVRTENGCAESLWSSLKGDRGGASAGVGSRGLLEKTKGWSSEGWMGVLHCMAAASCCRPIAI